jgi:hypothetical protein
MGGVPFAANPLSGLYYPFNWLLMFLPGLPLEIGFNASTLVHLVLAGAAMYALMQQGFGSGMWGALLAAVGYQGSPKLIAHLGVGHIGWVQGWAWLPVVVLCVLKACRSPSGQAGKWGVGAGVGLAVQFCADVRMAAYALMAVTTLLVATALGKLDVCPRRSPLGLKHWFREARWAIGPFAVFLGLAACQWLPTLILLPDTTRSSMMISDAMAWSLPWRYLGGLFLADHGGFHEWMTYIGVGMLAFSCVGIRYVWQGQSRWAEADRASAERWHVGWLVGLAVFGIWFSLGENGGLFQVLWRIVPGLGLLRVPPRAWVLVVFATTVLAGLGMEEAGKPKGRRRRGTRRWERPLLLAIGALPPMLVVGYWSMFRVPPLNLVVFGVATPLVIVLCGMQRIRNRAKWTDAAAVLLVVVDLWVVDSTLVEARSPKKVFAGGRRVAEWLGRQPGGFRVYSPSYNLPQHVAEEYGLELANGVDPLQLRVFAEFLTRAAGLEPEQEYSVTLPPVPEGSNVQTALEGVDPNSDMLAELGVRYAVSSFAIEDRRWELAHRCDDTYIYRNQVERTLAKEEVDYGIVLADGTVLYQYHVWPVYAGWVISGCTVAALIGWIACMTRKMRQDG